MRERIVSSAPVPPAKRETGALRVQHRLQTSLGLIGVATSGVLLYPKILLLAAGDLGAIGVGLIANLALAFGSLMFLRNAQKLRARAASVLPPNEHS